jgi:hypothetical protein
MSFSAQDLSVLAYANGFTHWHYRTRDPLAHLIDSQGYFAAAAEMLRPGDQITVNLIDPLRTHLATLIVLAIPTSLAPEIGLVAASLVAAPPAALAA